MTSPADDRSDQVALPPEARWLAARYHFLAELGRGGMATVYLARERRSGQQVAVKVVDRRHTTDSAAARRFAQEARTAAALQHPNIARTLAIEESGGSAVAIVTAYVRGETLRAALASTGAFSIERTVRVLRDVAAALAHAHACRIVHRDVKPANIILDADSGDALLTDFGIARPLDTQHTLLTGAGVAIGTPAYMAPEQIAGRVVDERADVYALALVGWEMLTGRSPWHGETLYAVLHKQQHEALPDLASLRPDIPVYLLAALDTALAKDPERRWRDAEVFLAQLTPRPTPLVARGARDEDAYSTDAATVRIEARPVPDDAEVVISPATPSASEIAEPGSAPEAVETGSPPETAATEAEVTEAEVTEAEDRGAEGTGAEGTGAAAGEPETTEAAVAETELPEAASAQTTATDISTFAPSSETGSTSATDPGELVRVPTTRTGAADAVRAPESTPRASVWRGIVAAALVLLAVAAAVRLATVARGHPGGATPRRIAAGGPLDSLLALTLPGTAPRDPATDPRCRSTAAADQRACLLQYIARDDAPLNRAYVALIGVLRRRAGAAEPPAVRSLRTEERTWLAQRDRTCRPTARDGRYWGVARAPCYAALAARRTAELRARITALSR